MPYSDPEKKRQQMRAWRAKNPGKLHEYNIRRAPKEKAYRQAHPEQYVQYARNARVNNPKRDIFIQTKARAKKHGTPFTIAQEEIFWPTKCPVLGVVLSYDKSYTGNTVARENQATLDRWDNAKGYVPGNTFVISHKANRWKSDMGRDDIEALLGYMMRGPTSADYCIEATETMGGYVLPDGAV